jgi:hypothetical protein
VSENHESVSRWHDAAVLASYALYEVSNGTERWAGGFAADGSRMEIIALVDGHEVSVESSQLERDAMRDVGRRRLSIGDMLWRHVLQDDNALALPYSVTIEAHDRVVTVDGVLRPVHGMRIEGDPAWVGTLRLEEVTLRITTACPTALVLRTCADPSSLPEMPS